jgi:arylsulfatase A-like enzyme
VDDLVAELVSTLEAKGVLDNTFVVFGSDNGYHMGDYRMGIGKMMPYDTDINVPLIVAGPRVPAGVTSDALVANVDLCPTIEDLGRGARTALVDGRSLVPLLRGQAPADWRKAVLVEHRRPKGAEQIGPDRESLTWNPPSYHAMRLDDALYVEYGNGQRAYYDLTKDPYELRNLASQLTPTQRSGLHRSLAAMRGCRGTDSCRAAERAAQPARSHPLQVVASG